MQTFGEKLKRERESRNTALAEIAGTTQIRLRYLEALEDNEFDALPGNAIGKFYIRAYAEILGFDPEPLIAEYDREQQRRKRERRPKPKPSHAPRPKRARPWLTAAPDGTANPPAIPEKKPLKAPKPAAARTAEPPPARRPKPAKEHKTEKREPGRAAQTMPPASKDVASTESRPVAGPAPQKVKAPIRQSDKPTPREARTSESRPAARPETREVRAPEVRPAPQPASEPATSAQASSPATRQHGTPTLPRAEDGVGQDEAVATPFDLGTMADSSEAAPRRISVGAVLLAVGLVIVTAWIYFAIVRGATAEGEPSRGDLSEPADSALTASGSDDGARAAMTVELPSPPEPVREDPQTVVDDSPPETVREEPQAVVEEAPAEPAVAAPTTPNRLTVSEFGVGRRVVSQRLEGRGEEFEEGAVVWFSTRVLGGGRGRYIRHVWFRDGKRMQTIKLQLGGVHWRTHSRKTLWGVGRWTVEARDSDGRVLARSEFDCIPRS